MKSLSGLSRSTGIPARLFSRALGLPIEKEMCVDDVSAINLQSHIEIIPSNAKEAREKYYEVANKYAKSSALLRLWISLCDDIDDILEAYYETEDESDDERIALARLNEIFLKKIREAPTIKGAQALLEKTPVRSNVERVALIRINEIYQKT